MRLFRCQACAQTVYFDNTRCERCGSLLGYLPEIGLMSALEPEVAPELLAVLDGAGLLQASGLPTAEQDAWLALVRPGCRYRFCSNARLDACNWMIPVESGETHCVACRHNNRVSDTGVGQNLVRWREIELAKHRLFYSLTRLQLPIPTRAEHTEGLAFDFLADPADPKAPRIVTGHAKGLITIALREADGVEREKMRQSMGEPYRTTIGHFRHETGHYFWDRLVRDGNRLDACRAVFGDERADYGQALRRHYAQPPSPAWQTNFISAYATMHPWEDFAETWAHYLHMVDTLETAGAHGVEVHPQDGRSERHTVVGFDPYRVDDLTPVIDNWLPLLIAINNLNRSMGQPDLYPFVLSAPVIGKLRFIHTLVLAHQTRHAA